MGQKLVLLTLKMATHQLFGVWAGTGTPRASLGGFWLNWIEATSLGPPSHFSHHPLPPNAFVSKKKKTTIATTTTTNQVSRSICLWNNYFKRGYNTDFSSNTEDLLSKMPFTHQNLHK